MRANGRAVLACTLILAVLAFVSAAARCEGTPQPAVSSTPELTGPPAPTTPPPAMAAAGADGDAQASSEAPAAAAAEAPASPPATTPEAPSSPSSILANNQVVVYYGTPLSSGLGILGALTPADAASAVAARARTYDELNGDLGAVGALDVIYSLAQSEPTENGLYIRHLEDARVDEYLRLAEEWDLQLFLDLQIGRAAIIDEVRSIEKFLLNPRVHVAIDPEYAVGPDGVPIATPGRISGDEINDVQAYLRELVHDHALPSKMLVVHQYMEGTVVEGDRVEALAEIETVFNMDGLGDVEEKKRKYEFFSSMKYSKHDAFNIFLIYDDRVMSEAEILGLSPVPRIVFYQ